MAALPYIQLYVADYLADTMHLTCEEHGAYLLLIFNYWQTGKPIRKDRLSKIIRISDDRWASVERSLNEFFEDDGEVWTHPRIEADLQDVHDAQQQRIAAGKASAKARTYKGKSIKPNDSNDLSGSTTGQRPFNERSTIIDTYTDTDIVQRGASADPAESNGHGQPGFEQMVLDDTNTADFARAVSIEYARTWGLPSAPPVGMQLGSTVCMRARSHPPAMNLDWWPRYFERCLTDDFLNGTKNPKFIADFSYLITEKTFASVINASQLESSHG